MCQDISNLFYIFHVPSNIFHCGLPRYAYNEKTDLAIFCPITSQVKGYPFEVKIPDDLEISGVILSDQIKSLDWTTRKAEFICKLPKVALRETLNKINVLLNP